MPADSIDWPQTITASDDSITDDFCLCPMATKTVEDGGRHPFAAFSADFVRGAPGLPFVVPPPSSYGINGWLCNPPPQQTINFFQLPTSYNWRRVTVKSANNIPLLLDSMWFDSYPDASNTPPPVDGYQCSWGFPAESKNKQIATFCMNRHDGFINGAFLDFSVKKVGLKELWKLKWHRKFDINGPWTKDHDPPPTWPDWMKIFKEY